MNVYKNPWDERFAAEDYVYGTKPNAFIREQAHRIEAGSRVLAIAEGEGRNAVYLAQQGLAVTAWDYAPSGLAKANNLAAAHHVQIQTEQVDVSKADWSEKWDAAVCVFGHFPTPLRRTVLEGVRQAVKPGGLYMTEVYSIHQLPYKSGGPKEIDLLYRPEEFLDTFRDWHILHFYMGEAVRNEGTLHTGLCHVIQFIGRKPN
ncbi:class I SAM-dependent methyltransferase [Aneurinibacillus uraniidurans]|uniref:class I SAM-dependent methyltransferase n=1 Tax=Aneurinibacillus uraniidurans TaxID=2966586 RepID=UPI00234A052E|nr:class I SAM-dependent methyltransferase [Aneurinibacillus sp. B1]WCN39645.1 class I SAM-dependent methyltransferase [Aneurinibacillus sp. B1]